eukprot:6201652-Pleurochrysis_carterae.AAC.1
MRLSADSARMLRRSCIYLELAESLRRKLEPVVFYCYITLQFTLYNLPLALLLNEGPVLFSADPQNGLFGWLYPHPGRILAQLWMAALVDWAGNLGFIAVMKYVPGLIVAAVMLIGPFVACFEGILVGVDRIPGPWTLLGAVVIVISSGAIAIGMQHQTKTVDIVVGDLKID